AGGELLLPLAMLAFTEPGCEVVTFDDGFQKFLNYTLTCGATPVPVPREADPAGAIQAALTPKTRIVLIDNPGNPTGWLLSPATIAEIHASLPTDVLLILDEAYVEFSSFGQAGLDLARDHRNVLTTRTFSKAYGLAGLRIGWAAGHRDVIGAVRRVIPTFPIPRPSLIGALAALGDVDHLASVTAEVGRIRDAAQTRLAAAGWDVAPSAANFLLIRAGRHAPEAVAEAVETLRAANILVRLLPRFRNAPAIRMTLGTAEDMARVYAALKI
ncbi:MAG: histidinol-phosphate transaminase, partial [Pseudomonadota bacterium]